MSFSKNLDFHDVIMKGTLNAHPIRNLTSFMFRPSDATWLEISHPFSRYDFIRDGKRWINFSKRYSPSLWICEDGACFSKEFGASYCAMGGKNVLIQYSDIYDRDWFEIIDFDVFSKDDGEGRGHEIIKFNDVSVNKGENTIIFHDSCTQKFTYDHISSSFPSQIRIW